MNRKLMRSIEMKFFRIAVDETGKNNTVVLKEKKGKRFLPIFIGPNEARSIESELKSEKMPRPMTHDLIINLCKGLNIEIISVFITKIIDSTFYADINFRLANGSSEIISIDARPSDALSIAIRAGCTLFCSEELLEEASITN